MAANQFRVFGKGHVAFHDASTHACSCFVGLLRVLRKLHGRTAMTDGEVGFFEVIVSAAQQFSFELAILHIADEKERARSELYILAMTRISREAVPFPVVIIFVRKYRGCCSI